MELTEDYFLNGLVRAVQPKRGFRAATDSVLLAAAVPATAGQQVLELGCGVGVAALCVMARTDAVVTGVEIQTDYANLACRNFKDRGAVVQADLTSLPNALRQRSFDHVMANPPYFDPRARASEIPAKDTANREDTPLDQWLDVACRRVRPFGTVTFIHLAERLPSLLAGMIPRLGGVAILPITARANRPARRVIVQGRKDARAPLRILPPLVMHEGTEHPGDQEHFTPSARSILRDGAPLLLQE
jgi:tRNA1Val (adenine37-N6)-methyltransferase